MTTTQMEIFFGIILGVATLMGWVGLAAALCDRVPTWLGAPLFVTLAIGVPFALVITIITS